MRQKLIVISMDALVYEDLKDNISDYPSFSRMAKEGAWVERVRSVYPTLTYPCHVTMATGRYPDSHTVTNNTEDLIGRVDPPWRMEHRFVKGEDILDAAKRAGLTTAAVSWPVMGNHPSCDYLVDECWPDHAATATSAEYRQKFIDLGTPEKLFDEIMAPILSMRIGRKQPDSTYFYTIITAELIRRYQPDLLLLHMGNVDHYRHVSGVFSPLVTRGVRESDEMLGMILDAIDEAGIADETNIVVTADHGQLNVTRTVHPNVLLREKGFIDTDDAGGVTGWRAYAFSMGMSAVVRLSDPNDGKLRDEVRRVLDEACASGLWGISRVYTNAQTAQAEHLDGDFSFVLETDGATTFGTNWLGAAAECKKEGITGLIGASHGYHPDRGARPTFLAMGPAIRPGVRVAGMNLVDGAPTYARILGIDLPGADGVPVTAILKEQYA